MEQVARTSQSLELRLRPPVVTREVGGFTRLFAGGVPVTPVNLALLARSDGGASESSLRAYRSSTGLFLRFAASRDLGLLDITNAEFTTFVSALAGHAYVDANQEAATIPGRRSSTTVRNIVGRLYGLFADIEEAYGVAFDWRRYRAARQMRDTRWTGLSSSTSRRPGVAMTHGPRPKTREPLDLPDEQFALALGLARTLWHDAVADGDRAYAIDPEAQRGALYWRNVAMLYTMRFAGARRAEVGPIDLADVDRARHTITLLTKGRQGAKEHVVLVPMLGEVISRYALEHRPNALTTRSGRADAVDPHAVFVSHSVQNYGRRISPETVRDVMDSLSGALDQPWRDAFTPHLLRHAFAYSIQRVAGPIALTANMRHRSIRSADAYRGAAGIWAADLRDLSERSSAVFERAGVALR